VSARRLPEILLAIVVVLVVVLIVVHVIPVLLGQLLEELLLLVKDLDAVVLVHMNLRLDAVRLVFHQVIRVLRPEEIGDAIFKALLHVRLYQAAIGRLDPLQIVLRHVVAAACGHREIRLWICAMLVVVASPGA